MSDLKLTLTDAMTFDLAMLDQGVDFATEDGLETAVILSIFLDRRAADDDVIPDGTNNRRGSWLDDYAPKSGFHLGSKLWLLSREKTLPTVLARCKQYLEDALQWLVDDGIAELVDVTTSWAAAGVLRFEVVVDGAPSGRYQKTFEHSLESAA